MSWIKKGKIYDATQQDIPWVKSHSCVPTSLLIDEETIRIYYAPRNSKGQSIPTYFDVSAADPSKILYVHKEPVMELGQLGTFDDGGIMPCCTVRVGELIYLYYVGWNPSVSVDYRNAIGLAISSDGGETFQRKFQGALVDRSREEPFFTASPWIMKEQEDLWHMWYASSTGFVMVNGKPEPIYVIKYASSIDGITWKRDNITCIKPLHEEEANARPTVIKEDGIYKMWFAYRGCRDFRDGKDAYQIGYAESTDAINWDRKEEALLPKPHKGWDGKMQTYPDVINTKHGKYIFYNGNGSGATGIGYAIWDQKSSSNSN